MLSEEKNLRLDWKTNALLFGGFFVLMLVVYGSSLWNNFIGLDDPYVIYNNLAIREISLATLKHIFTTYDPELYTPLTFFTFQLNYAIGGLQPFVYHLTNLVLHTTNAVLVAWVLTLLGNNRIAGILAGLLFAVHPVNTEVVAWMTARKEVLSTFFFLLSLIAYMQPRTRGSYVLSCGLFLLALLSKVNVFVLPALLLLIDFLQNKRLNRQLFIEKIPYVALSIIFVIIGLLPKVGILSSTTLSEKILMASKGTLFYLWKFLIPTDLSVLYPHYGPIAFSEPQLLACFIGLAILLGAVLISLRWTRSIAFGFLFFFVAISPTFVHFNRNAGIISDNSTGIQTASDHYLYVPMIGLLSIVMFVLTALWERPRTVRRTQQMHRMILTLICSVLLICSFLSHAQAMIWKNSETLFSHALALYPHSTAARVSLSVIYRKTGRFAEELKILQEGLPYGKSSKLLTGLGSIAARNGNYPEADRYYTEAIQADPTNSEPYFGQGVILSEQGKLESAYAAYARAIALDPMYAAAYNNIGSLKLGEEKEKEAEENFVKAITLNPSSVEGHFNLGALYRRQKRIAEATEHFSLAIALDPTLIDAHLELVPLLLQAGKNTAAFEHIRAVLALDPENSGAKALVKEMMKMGIIGTK